MPVTLGVLCLGIICLLLTLTEAVQVDSLMDLWVQDLEIDLKDPLEAYLDDADEEADEQAQSISGLPLEDLLCREATFRPDAISAAITKALSIIQPQLPHWKNKRREQPHYYNNYEGFDFPECTEGRMYEFPILVGGKIHRGGSTGRKNPPGAHRVILKAEKNGTYCGLITHEGADSWGSFIMCE